MTGMVGTAAVVLGSRSLRLDRRGRLAVVVTNPNTFAVSGTLTMTIAGRRAAHAKKTSKPIMIGSAPFSLQASGRVTLRLKVTPAGRAALRRRSVSATATLVTRAAGRPESRTTSQLTIRPPTRAHR
jgi:hypothetical protein